MDSEHEANITIKPADPLAVALSAVVDRYRQGVVERFAAQSEIFKCIAASDTGSGAGFDKSAIASLYLEQIAEIDEINASAEDRGHGGVAAATSRSVSASAGQRRKRNGKARRASGADDPSESDSSDEDSDSRSERAPKRSKVKQDPTKFAFARSPATQLLDSLGLGDNRRKTRELAGQYALDLNHAKWALKFDGGGHLPPLPDSEWSRVLADRPVNLDAINSGAFSADFDEKVTHKIGELSISTGGSTRASKPVTTGLEWYHAFDLASDAIVHAFPHRRTELRVYREYIKSLFSALHSSHHSAIISLDKAIRRHVSESSDLELSQVGSFYALQMAYLTPAGVGSSRGAAQPQAKARGSGSDPNEICKQYNSNQCIRRQCKFRHVCDTRINGEYCRGAHRRSECSKKD